MNRWREAMAEALYGSNGFYVRPGPGPAGHFRTSAHASPLFAQALLRLLERVDEALGRPDPLEVVDVGAGRGELLSALCAAAPPGLGSRLRPTAVERAPGFAPAIPVSVTGLLLATEWLDNVPLDAAQVDEAGVTRYVTVEPGSGVEALGAPVTGEDAAWLSAWWPLSVPGSRAEIGRTRDEAWAGAVKSIVRGAALAVDYGHLVGTRPPLGTLTGYRDGHEVPPVPDGSCDITAHVALDSVARAGSFALHPDTQQQAPPGAAGCVSVCRAEWRGTTMRAGAPQLATQRAALPALGVTAVRPPIAVARADPGGYLHRLVAASAAAELTDPSGLGGHFWLLQPVGVNVQI